MIPLCGYIINASNIRLKHRNTQPTVLKPIHDESDHIEQLLQKTLPPQQLIHMQSARIRNLQLELQKLQTTHYQRAKELRNALATVDCEKQHAKRCEKDAKQLQESISQLQTRTRELEGLVRAKDNVVASLTEDKQHLSAQRYVLWGSWNNTTTTTGVDNPVDDRSQASVGGAVAAAHPATAAGRQRDTATLRRRCCCAQEQRTPPCTFMARFYGNCD